MANINHLINHSEDRKIRAVLSASGQVVNVYEPTVAQVNEIISLQEKWLDKDRIVMTGADLIRFIFPMLTDIEGIDEMTDEDIKEISENPSLLYMQVQYEIEIIFKEIFHTLVLANRRALADQELELAMHYSTQEMFDKVLSNAAKHTGSGDLKDKVAELADRLEEKVEQGEKEALDKIEKSTKSKYDSILSQYEDAFSDRSNVIAMENSNVND